MLMSMCHRLQGKNYVIKECVCVVVYSLHVYTLSAIILVHVVLFVTKQLDLFPVKD